MIVEVAGRNYELVCGSDIDRDGMFLEAWQDVKTLVLEAFFSDADGSFTFTAHQEGLPFGLVELFVAEARRRLPPVTEASQAPA